MFERVLLQMRERIRKYDYLMTVHARKEMIEDNLTIYDVEQGFLSGRIVEHQKDRETAESKYCIEGTTVAGDDIEILAKFGVTGKLVIITVYLA